MTMVDVGIFMGIIALFHIGSDWKKDINEVRWERKYQQNQCVRTENDYKKWGLKFDPEKCGCLPPRYNIPRRWYEHKTHKEQIEEFEKRSKRQ